MSRREFQWIGLWVAAGFTMTVALFWSNGLNAGNDVTGQVQPVLKVGEVQLSVTLGKNDRQSSLDIIAPGSKPNATLVLANQGTTAARIPWTATLMVRSAPSFISRGPAVSRSVDVVSGVAVLKAGETQNVALELNSSLQANTSGYIQLQSEQQTLIAGQFTVAAPATTQPAAKEGVVAVSALGARP